MERAFTDILVDEYKSQMGNLREQTREMFKGTRPFRQVKVSDAQRIANYLTMTPEMHQQLQNDFGQGYQNYVQGMEDLILKYKGGDKI